MAALRKKEGQTGSNSNYERVKGSHLQPQLMSPGTNELNEYGSHAQQFEYQRKPKELLVMTIEIGNGQKDTIHVFENDDPNDLAYNFCEKHNLDSTIVFPLSQNIYTNMEQVINERVELLNRYATEHTSPQQNGPILERDDEASTYGNGNADNYDTEPPVESVEGSKNGTPYRVSQKPPLYQSSPTYSAGKTPTGFRAQTQAESSKRSKRSKRSKTPDLRDRTSAKLRTNSDHPNDNQLRRSFYNSDKNINESDLIDDLITNPYLQRNSRDGYHLNSELTFVPQINQNSVQILEQKYQNRNAKVMTQKAAARGSSGSSVVRSQSKKRPYDENDTINYGSLLYHKGLKRKEDRQKNASEIIRERIEKEEKECTFHPEINPISVEIVNSKSRIEAPEDTLIRAGKETREKIERQRGIRQTQELENCSFKPEINPISEKITQEKERMMSNWAKERHLKLFNDHKVRQAQQEMRSRMIADDECTFSPAINPITNKALEQTSFDQRTKNYLDRKDYSHKVNKQKYGKELIDENTGVPYFKPLVGRPPKTHHDDDQTIWDHLYNKRIELDRNKRMLYDRDQQLMQSKMARAGDKSDLIVRSIRRKRLEEVFQFFDSDGDGLISPSKIDISTVSTEILELFAPLLCEMEELGQTLTLEDFIEGSDRLLKTLPVSKKDVLMGRRDRNISTPEYPFKPELNYNSQKLAEKRRPKGEGTMYDIYFEEQKNMEEKILHERERKLEQEMKQCSFKPLFFSNPNISRSTESLNPQYNQYLANFPY